MLRSGDPRTISPDMWFGLFFGMGVRLGFPWIFLGALVYFSLKGVESGFLLVEDGGGVKDFFVKDIPSLGNDHISHQMGKRKIIDSKSALAKGYLFSSLEGYRVYMFWDAWKMSDSTEIQKAAKPTRP